MTDANGAVVVTGAGGLIGAAVLRHLMARGDAVIALDRAATTASPCPVTVHELGDAHRLHEILRAQPVRAIVHAGGASGPMVSPESPARVAAVNLTGLVDVLEAARIQGIRRMVWFSSVLAYGPIPGGAPIDEDTLLRPHTVYGATKAAGEALLHAYAASYGLEGTALRVASCYGPGRTTNCFVRLLIENALAGRPTGVPDPAARTRQHIHVDDVASAVLAVLDAPTLPARAYNIGPGRVQSAREVAAEVGAAVPGVELVQDSAAADWNSFPLGPLSVERARRDFGFRPRIGFGAGARTYIDWLQGRAQS